MAQIKVVQNSFTSGEVGEYLDAREDLDLYQTGAKTVENFFVLPQGGLLRRTGFEYLAGTNLTGTDESATGFMSHARLIPFRFSTDSGNSSAYTTGVTVGSGYVDIVVNSSTPSTLYYYCTNHGGMGGQINVVDNSEYKAFISASGGFLFKADTNNLISFGQSVSGGDGSSTKSFVLKSDNVFLSGSNVNVLTRRFFFGDDGAQFISGSNGNIEISSSMFHLYTQNNKVTISASITATDG